MPSHKMLTRARTRLNPSTPFHTLTNPPPRNPRPVPSWLHTPRPNPYHAAPAKWRNYRGPASMSPLSLGPPALSLNDHILDENEVDHVHETHYETNVGTGGWAIIYPAGMKSIDEELEGREKRGVQRRRRVMNGRVGKRGKGKGKGMRDGKGRFVKVEEVKEEEEATIRIRVVEVEVEPKVEDEEQRQEPEDDDDLYD